MIRLKFTTKRAISALLLFAVLFGSIELSAHSHKKTEAASSEACSVCQIASHYHSTPASSYHPIVSGQVCYYYFVQPVLSYNFSKPYFKKLAQAPPQA